MPTASVCVVMPTVTDIASNLLPSTVTLVTSGCAMSYPLDCPAFASGVLSLLHPQFQDARPGQIDPSALLHADGFPRRHALAIQFGPVRAAAVDQKDLLPARMNLAVKP